MTQNSSAGTEIVLLGTAGGPRLRATRAGISSAVVTGGAVYLVDFGYGACRQAKLAGLDLGRLRAGFVTHLHSDHVADLANLLLYGWYEGLEGVQEPAKLFGPGSRGGVPAPSADLEAQTVACPDDPVPGFAATVGYLYQAFATDLNDRMRDNGRSHPDLLLAAHDIELPPAVPFDPETAPAPPMDPVPVYRDEHVEVSAILVQHAPMTPAYAFRFDTAAGSVVFSGDTGVCDNMITLATGADVLVHEAIDEQWVQRLLGGVDTPRARATLAHHTTAHTSIPDAGRIAQKAGASTLVLNHLVPADSGHSRWHEAAEHFTGRLIVGEDLDRIPLGH
ncbi:MBL fold metallo-hydrolase [Amycolatopsis alkalitolerans]|uniref:MBL fold metallo-hydrolase n=1 Tax=Amycolatopsis alkalitolerans TaxID=2547244 RepID=A0A5C4M2M0_9PSEU|nr:MBL fold metallo-hydrolase [Amycolatopsis alkalitolerans]TNC24936.1 MBL fold metallo-hydrolase [Amycolatopsis alkalitolerans]